MYQERNGSDTHVTMLYLSLSQLGTVHINKERKRAKQEYFYSLCRATTEVCRFQTSWFFKQPDILINSFFFPFENRYALLVSKGKGTHLHCLSSMSYWVFSVHFHGKQTYNVEKKNSFLSYANLVMIFFLKWYWNKRIHYSQILK